MLIYSHNIGKNDDEKHEDVEKPIIVNILTQTLVAYKHLLLIGFTGELDVYETSSILKSRTNHIGD